MAVILIVDDAEFLRLRISKMLTESGHEVLEAENGIQAISIYKSEAPDIILMDLRCPSWTDSRPSRR